MHAKPATLLGLVGPATLAAAQLHDLAVAAGLEYFGTALGEHIDDAPYYELAANGTEFGSLTPENGQKWAYVEPTRGEFVYTAGAEVVAGVAEENGQILRCHALVWHSQLPDWGEFCFSYTLSIPLFGF